MIDSRCGLSCSDCSWKSSQSCGGCIETDGHPFHGECPVALCCQDKGYNHCGECDIIPCDTLYAYSYLDPEHGDKPQGARVEQCRRWAAESGKQAWKNVLLTDSGFYFDVELEKPITALIDRLREMLAKPFADAKVLLIPTATMRNKAMAKEITERLRNGLLKMGFSAENIVVHDIDGSLSESEAMQFDIIYFTGGSAPYLNKRARETGFDRIIKKMVYANKVYIGVSGGSMLAMVNFNINKFSRQNPMVYAGLSLLHAYFSVHNDPGTQNRTDLPLPHIALKRNQAIAVSWDGYEVIDG